MLVGVNNDKYPHYPIERCYSYWDVRSLESYPHHKHISLFCYTITIHV